MSEIEQANGIEIPAEVVAVASDFEGAVDSAVARFGHGDLAGARERLDKAKRTIEEKERANG